ncbi:MAG: GNAT family N-acetyltransferase [Victivallales bacterium]|jgi:[ribosomal protein S5]-alanine N-acetyltransferase|nr:GNAT family N-acetyltransferase [Victivallales bacterium]
MGQRPTLRTERLLLRPFELSDARDVQRLAGDRAIAEMTATIPHPYEDGMAEEWIGTHQERFDAGDLVNFAIVRQDTGELVGAIGLMGLANSSERGEIGYWIGKPDWGHGYCTEAARAAITYGFSVLRLNRIHGRYCKRNPASGRVMAKIGMTYEGCLRQHEKKWGQIEDMVLYGILRAEWESRTEHGDASDGGSTGTP